MRALCVGVRAAGGENALLLEMRGFLSGTSVTPDDASADRCTAFLADDLVQRRIWLSTQANVQIRGMALFVVGLMFHRD